MEGAALGAESKTGEHEGRRVLRPRPAPDGTAEGGNGVTGLCALATAP